MNESICVMPGGTSWLINVKNPNLFPGECPRRFFDSDRKFLNVFYVPLRRPHLFVLFLFRCFSFVFFA